MLLVPDAGKVEVEEGSSPLALMTQRSNASPKRPEPSSPVANTAAHAECDEQGEDEEAVPEAAAAAPGNLLGGDNEAALASRRRKRDACVADPCAVVLERRSRPKAAAGPVDIPPEVRDWLRQPTRKTGQPTRRKLQEHMAAMDAERLDDAAELCAVCTDSLDETDVTNPVGVMPCCGKRVHKTCATKWRASNNNLKVYVNVPLKYEAPDTRCCMFCRSPEATKYCSTRRMFGAEIEGAAGLPPPPPVPRCRRT